MRNFSTIPMALSLLALCAAQVMAQDSLGPKTREQVKAELMEAIRTGNMPAGDDTGRMQNA